MTLVTRGAVRVRTPMEQRSTTPAAAPVQSYTEVMAAPHVLLVDDHPSMARVSAKLLETMGYRATVFDDPRAALEAFRNAPLSFDVVLTDLSMPHLSGTEFAQRLKEVRPEIPVIVSTGRALDLDAAAQAALKIDAILLKPWRIEQAIATLEKLLR